MHELMFRAVLAMEHDQCINSNMQ